MHMDDTPIKSGGKVHESQPRENEDIDLAIDFAIHLLLFLSDREITFGSIVELMSHHPAIRDLLIQRNVTLFSCSFRHVERQFS